MAGKITSMRRPAIPACATFTFLKYINSVNGVITETFFMQTTLFTSLKRGMLFLWLLITFSACSNSDNNTRDRSLRRYYNLSYGSHSRQSMDVYLPEGRGEETPFLVLVHGGAWVEGDKGSFNALQDSLLVRGIASATINYRYAAADVHYEQLMADVQAALEFCYSKRGEWNIRGDRYILAGASAGAHMALLYGYSYNTTGRVAAVISAAGPTDLAQTDYLNYAALLGLLDEIELMVGAGYTAGQPLDARFTAASPRYHIRHLPTLMLHGTNDLVVPYNQSEILAADLSAQGFAHRLVPFQGAGHDLGLANATYLQLLLAEMESWCKTYGR